MLEIPQWPYFLSVPDATGYIRSQIEDFVVEEIPRIQPAGEGGHLWLWVEKHSANTDWVARELAKATACPFRDVGYAGLKDRHAITRQWFSIPASQETETRLEQAEIEGVEILESRLHQRKLKRGTLDGNRFRIRIRHFSGDIDQTGQRLEQISQTGVPNYFGPQRFGREGGNVERGFNLLQKGVRLQRNKRSIYLSAIRSFLFNQVLAERVREGSWNRILDGELAMLNGSQSIFSCNLPDADIEDRCLRLDIHPTGPMPGEKGTQTTAQVAALEQSVLQQWPELTELLSSQRIKATRRALRLIPSEFDWGIEGDNLVLNFALPAGSFATTVLREILIICRL